MISDYLRLATVEDIPTLIKFARNFHRASPYNLMRFDTEKGRKFLRGIIEGPPTFGIVLVALKDKKPIGFLVGVCEEPVFTSSKVAMELGWWIEEEHRGTRASALIFSAYEDWAFRVGCTHVQGSYLPGVSKDLTNFYKNRGYVQTESSFVKTLLSR